MREHLRKVCKGPRVVAVAFGAALKELDPATTIGLTASVDTGDHVIYTYPLYRANADRFVKAPVLAFRKAGYDATPASEEQQPRDAFALRVIKQIHYDAYAQANNRPSLNAIAFVVCSNVDHAIPLERDGGHDKANVRPCHSAKTGREDVWWRKAPRVYFY